MSQKLRLLHVFPSFELGGAQRRFSTLVNEGSADFTHTVFALDGNYGAQSLITEGLITRLDAAPPPKNSLFGAIRACRRLLKDIRPDLLITYNWGSIEWNLANGLAAICPSLHVQDGFGSDEQAGELRARKIARKRAYRRATGVIVPSRQLEDIARYNWRIKPARLHYIPNGIDTLRFDGHTDQTLLAQHGITSGDRLIGTVAGLRPEKNLGRLIEAFGMVAPAFPDCKLIIVGDGVGRSALRMLAERIGLKSRIIFTGALAAPEKILPAFEIFALSSDTEQMPLSVVEAMAAGLPIASTNVGDIRLMVSPDNADHISGREAGDLAASLEKLLADPATARMIGAENRAKAQNQFGKAAMIAAYETQYRAAIAR